MNELSTKNVMYCRLPAGAREGLRSPSFLIESCFAGATTSSTAVFPRRRCSGFTLVEMVAVIAVIGILAGMILSGAVYMQNKAGRARTLATIKSLEVALENYKGDFSVFPPDYISKSLRSYAGSPQGRNGDKLPYGTGNADPAECLWYFLEQAMFDIGKRAYMNFKSDQLCDRDNDKNMEVADGFGYPINYKSSYPANGNTGTTLGYNFSTAMSGQPLYAPRHNTDSFDLCSYGRDATTLKTYDTNKRSGTSFSPSEINFSGNPQNYYKVPFDKLGDRSGQPYSFGGEGDDDINNWQNRQ